MSHTKGPLCVREGSWSTPTYSDEKCTKISGTYEQKVQMVCLEDYGALAYVFDWYGNAAANAHLYAASPELLEACEAAVGALEYLDCHPETRGGHALASLRAALAKARGEVPETAKEIP